MTDLRIPEVQVDERAEQLIHEFMDHFNEYVENDPTAADRKREVFEAWAIQKIAGLQLAVELLAGYQGPGGNAGQDYGDVPF